MDRNCDKRKKSDKRIKESVKKTLDIHFYQCYNNYRKRKRGKDKNEEQGK